MSCQDWTGKLDTYLDGELPPAEDRAVYDHIRNCASCAADAVERLQLKHSIRAAGQRYVPDPAFRARMQQSSAPSKRARRLWSWGALASGVAVVLVAAGLWTIHDRHRTEDRQLISELVDLHVSTLASTTPVDVVSSDRHTVKPWFEGKIPFSFNLPELQGSSFVLAGGRVSYFRQSPGAELVFHLRQHQISVFLFQQQAVGEACGAKSNDLSLTVRSWSQNGVCYFAVGDVSSQDLDALSKLIRQAG